MNYMQLFLLLTHILLSSSFVAFSRKICKQYKQHYLSDKFVPVLEEKTLIVEHNNKKFNKIKHNIFAQIGSNPKFVNNEDYHWFDGDGMIHGIYFNNSEIVYRLVNEVIGLMKLLFTMV